MVHDPVKQVEENVYRAITLESPGAASLSLRSQMQALSVPGVSVAVIDGGKIAWTKGYGVKAVGEPHPVTPETRFQACSISKAVTGMAAMALVQEGLLTLDDDINQYLKRWQVPENENTEGQKVTLRGLLTHSAGTNVTGFKGYPRGEPIPGIQQILNGESPANSPAVRVMLPPGTRFVYSGGGYTIVQLLMMEVTGKSFPQLMKEWVLESLGMLHSSFEQPLPEAHWGEEAAGHQVDGTLLPGRWRVFPELAAAGLWTTPADLARFILGVQRAVQGNFNEIWSQKTAKMMTSPQFQHWGLGPGVGGEGQDSYFYHSGGNQGYRCEMAASRFGGQGAVVMTNSNNGTNLAMQVIRGISHAYEWPHFKAQTLKAVPLDDEEKLEITGMYQSLDDPQSQARVTLEDGHLYLEVPVLFPPKFRLFAQAKHRFFEIENGYRFVFTRRDNDIICAAHMFDEVFYSKKIE